MSKMSKNNQKISQNHLSSLIIYLLSVDSDQFCDGDLFVGDFAMKRPFCNIRNEELIDAAFHLPPS